MFHLRVSHALPGGFSGWRSRARERRGERGLTLVELLIAVALLGFILLGIAPLFIASVRSNYAANEYTSIHILARDRLEQLMNLTFDDPQLAAGIYPNDQASQLPDPTNPSALSTVRNPFTITYQVTQWAIPPAGPTGGPGVPAKDAPFTPTRVLAATQAYQYKRIDVEVRAGSGPLGIGARVSRVSGALNNPAPLTDLSLVDPCPAATGCFF